jgi:hypothetical protein
MTTSERAQRLRIDTRLAILDDISALNKQRKAAIQAGQRDEAESIQDIIEDLNDRRRSTIAMASEIRSVRYALQRTSSRTKLTTSRMSRRPCRKVRKLRSRRRALSPNSAIYHLSVSTYRAATWRPNCCGCDCLAVPGLGCFRVRSETRPFTLNA